MEPRSTHPQHPSLVCSAELPRSCRPYGQLQADRARLKKLLAVIETQERCVTFLTERSSHPACPSAGTSGGRAHAEVVAASGTVTEPDAAQRAAQAAPRHGKPQEHRQAAAPGRATKPSWLDFAPRATAWRMRHGSPHPTGHVSQNRVRDKAQSCPSFSTTPTAGGIPVPCCSKQTPGKQQAVKFLFFP